MFPWILLGASIIHITWGVALIVHPQVSRLLILLGNDRALTLSNSTELLGALYILFSLLALWGLVNEKRYNRNNIIMLLFPQYLMLILTFLSDVYILLTGHYQNNNFDFWDGLVILISMITVSFLHTCAILERYYFKWQIISYPSRRS